MCFKEIPLYAKISQKKLGFPKGFPIFICTFAITMTKVGTARQELAFIQEFFFKGEDLDKACLLKGKERRAYRLAQVDRLLSRELQYALMAMPGLSDMFWTADEGRVQYEENPSPLLLLVEQQTLTDTEMNRLRLILEIAGLYHDLSLHFEFDLEDAFGIKNNHPLGYNVFSVSNKRLVKWLTTTEYEHVAMHTAYIMKKFTIGVYEYGHYQPAQDKLAELYSTEYHEVVREPAYAEMPPRDYVRTILDAMLQIDRHWKRGMRLKLKPDVIKLHDEICGVVPYKFDKGVLAAAQELFDYMDCEVYGNQSAVVFERFAKKVREVRSKYLGKGWLTDDSLAFSYLMAHAEWCSRGYWREEDEAL